MYWIVNNTHVTIEQLIGSSLENSHYMMMRASLNPMQGKAPRPNNTAEASQGPYKYTAEWEGSSLQQYP